MKDVLKGFVDTVGEIQVGSAPVAVAHSEIKYWRVICPYQSVLSALFFTNVAKFNHSFVSLVLSAYHGTN